MKVSVITVSYNSAATIADTLRSVEHQSHSDIEYIVVDGASTDGTQELIRSGSTRVSRFISEPDGGIYDAMNKGLVLATGDRIGFLNADDVFADRDAVARIAAVGRSHEFVYGDIEYVSAEGSGRVVRRWRSGTYHVSRLRYGWMPAHPAFYASRALIADVGGFDMNYRIAADYDFMLRCLLSCSGTGSYVDEVLVKMRTGGASNRSAKALWRKSREDLRIARSHRLGGLFTIACKNLRKLPQFFAGPGGSRA